MEIVVMREYLEPSARCPGYGRCLMLVLGILWGSPVGSPARAQVPGLSAKEAPAPETKKADDKERPASAPTKDNPEATVATTSGPIVVDKPVDDPAVRQTLEHLLSRYPGVRTAEV